MEFTSKLERFYSDLWHLHIMVPQAIAEQFTAKDRRVVCTINGQETFQCALMPHQSGDYFININNERRKRLQITVGEPLTVQLEKDESEYGLPVPEEFQALIDMDEEGRTVFHSLTKGKQRSLLHIIGKPKRSETRLKKAIVAIDYLKAVDGKLDFKALNQAFKDANQR